jgi:predicted nuclease of predicted toxin-antitoxin system
MRFLIDAQLLPALARWLVSQGYEAQHILDVGLLDADDSLIWQHAGTIDAVIVTKDADFAMRRTLAADGPAVLWLRVGNTRKAALLHWLEPLLPEIIQSIKRGDTLLEVVSEDT